MAQIAVALTAPARSALMAYAKTRFRVARGMPCVEVIQHLLNKAFGVRHLILLENSSPGSRAHPCGLLRPEAGCVRYRKVDLTQATAAQLDAIHRHGIGFVFQTPYLFQALTAYENLELALRASGEKVARDRIFEMLEKLGLDERAEHLPSALSAGQKRRLVLGRALLSCHDVLLADEPTNDLDEEWSECVFELLRGFCADEERSVVLVTYDRSYAARADSMYLLEGGKLREVAEQ